jgi:hypothetical protein
MGHEGRRDTSPSHAGLQCEEHFGPKNSPQGDLPRGLVIRNTFVELEEPNAKDLTPKRSSSAPPKRGSLFSEDVCGSDFEPVSEQATRLPLPKIAVPVHATPMNEDPNVRNPEKKLRVCPQLELVCSCGVRFDAEGNFCYNCSVSKPLQQQDMATTASKEQDISKYPVKCLGIHDSGEKVALLAGRANNLTHSLLGTVTGAAKKKCALTRGNSTAPPGIHGQCDPEITPCAIKTSCQSLGEECPSVEGPITTLMICNMPSRLAYGRILDAINSYGFTNTYDMFYLPLSRCGRGIGICNRGYAFVNFKHPEAATEFASIFQDVLIPDCASKKCLFSRPAHHQGYKKNMEVHAHVGGGCLITFGEEGPPEVRYM